MSCYLRHLKDVLAEAGIEATSENKRQIDKALHGAVGIAYKDCPATWRRLKQDILADKEKLQSIVEEVRKATG